MIFCWVVPWVAKSISKTNLKGGRNYESRAIRGGFRLAKEILGILED